MFKDDSHYRARALPVRQWLQVGVASAGMGAALWGFSLVAPQTGIASADTTEGAAVSAGPERDAAKGASVPASHRKPPTSMGRDDDGEGDSGADVSDHADGHDEGDIEAERNRPDERARRMREENAINKDNSSDLTVDDENAADPDSTGSAIELLAVDVPANADTVDAPSQQGSVVRGSVAETRHDKVAEAMEKWQAANDALVDSLSVSERTKTWLDAAFVSMRRSFFNVAPTVDPVQISGVIDGPIAGTLGGIDPDGDTLVYVLTAAPKNGNVVLNRDGTFVYTPTNGFNGVDVFEVRAIDLGLHINLLDLLRPLGSRPETALMNQGAIKFDFSFGQGSQLWTAARREALNTAANRVSVYFRVEVPVVLDYRVAAINDPESDILGFASSAHVSREPGYWHTVVQDKLLTGSDSNGDDADGEITANFGVPWALGDTVAKDEWDFQSTMMHELLHTFGFSSRVRQPGTNTQTSWSSFDAFIVTADGIRPFTADHEWNSLYDENILGNGGMYFGGPNAVAAYGGLVPLYTKKPWNSSTMDHLHDDIFGWNTQVMAAILDAGFLLRTLSPVELGILKDLGYTVVPLAVLSR